MKTISRRKFFAAAVGAAVIAAPGSAAASPSQAEEPAGGLLPRWVDHSAAARVGNAARVTEWHTLTCVTPPCIEVGVELMQDPPDHKGRRRWTCRMNGHGQDLGVCTTTTAKRKAEEWAVKMLAAVITAIQGMHRPNGLKELL